MSNGSPLAFNQEPSALPSDAKERHEALVELFGQFLFWLRNWAIDASRNLVESEDARGKLGAIRRKYYEGVAQMPQQQREAAMLLAEETVDGFAERLVWFLGDEGTDSKFGARHAYRFRVEMEIVDIETGRIVASLPVETSLAMHNASTPQNLSMSDGLLAALGGENVHPLGVRRPAASADPAGRAEHQRLR